MYAASADSYRVFASLFDPIIDDYHGKVDKHTTDLDYTKLHAPLLKDSGILSTRIRVARNLSGYPLGPALSRQQRLDVMTKVVLALQSLEGELKGTFYPLEGMSKET